MMKNIFIPLVMAGCLFMSGCISHSKYISNIKVPPIIPLEESDLLPDQQLVMAAIVERLRGNPDVEGVTFVPDGRMVFGDTIFKYEAFAVTHVALFDYQAEMVEAGRVASSVDGSFLFTDAFGRRAGCLFSVLYDYTKDGISIYECVAMPIAVDFPTTEAYIVPTSALEEQANSAKFDSFLSLYTTCVTHAIPMAYNKGEGRVETKTDLYTVVVFCMDRLLDSGSFDVSMTTERMGMGHDIAKPLYVNFDGWRVAMFGANFKPGEQKATFFLRASYNSTPNNGGDSIVVGEFDGKPYSR